MSEVEEVRKIIIKFVLHSINYTFHVLCTCTYICNVQSVSILYCELVVMWQKSIIHLQSRCCDSITDLISMGLFYLYNFEHTCIVCVYRFLQSSQQSLYV